MEADLEEQDDGAELGEDVDNLLQAEDVRRLCWKREAERLEPRPGKREETRAHEYSQDEEDHHRWELQVGHSELADNGQQQQEDYLEIDVLLRLDRAVEAGPHHRDQEQHEKREDEKWDDCFEHGRISDLYFICVIPFD